MFLACSQGKRASALFAAAFFLLLQASVLLAQPRPPYPNLPSGISSYLLVVDMSNDSAYVATATSRSRHRMAADHSGDFAEYGVSLWETAGISGEVGKKHITRRPSENPELAHDARLGVVSRK
jgi:hypothetical protein